MDEDKKSEGRFEVRSKPKDDYRMKAVDFDKIMQEALKVPPMPVKQKERVGEGWDHLPCDFEMSPWSRSLSRISVLCAES